MKLQTVLAATAAIAITNSALPAVPHARWPLPKIHFPARLATPIVTATGAELARLRRAVRSTPAERRVIASTTRRAAEALKSDLTFPPRGGQHNQWYQCDRCQIALRTIDPTHHRCPKCTKVYSGQPYDDVVFSRHHYRNLRGAHAAAWAWAVTGRREFADHTAKVLLGYAARYAKYPYHSASRDLSGWGARSGGHLFEQTLTEASALAGYIAPAYDLIHASGALSDAQRRTIRTGLIEPMLANIARNRAGKSNWQTWHNAAMLWGGAVIGAEKWVRRALTDPGNGFSHQMRISVTPEGMWYENSWGYHFYTLRAMVLIAEGARRLGIDLWSHPTLRKMFTVAVDYAMPDGTLPRFGDDVNTRVSSTSAYLEFLYHARPAAALLPHLSPAPTWDSILLGRPTSARPAAGQPASRLFPGAGHAILRTPGPDGQAAVLTFGPYGGFHGHYDKLSFVYFAHGRELGVDPGRARSQAYRLPIHRHWYKATLSHNTVLVDGVSQRPAAGVLKCFAANDHTAVALARCDGAYPRVRHRRLLVLTREYLLVFDTLAPAAAVRTFDWVYHNRARTVTSPSATNEADLPNDIRGREYVTNVRAGRTDEPVRVVFSGPAVATHLLLAGEKGTTVHVGDGVGGSVVDRVPMVIVRRRGRTGRFAAVLEPVAAAAKPKITRITARPHADGSHEITVLRDGHADVITVTPDAAVTVRRNGAVMLIAKPRSEPTREPVPSAKR